MAGAVAVAAAVAAAAVAATVGYCGKFGGQDIKNIWNEQHIIY